MDGEREIQKEGENVEKETMTVAEAARMLGCAQQAVREHIKRGIWTFGERIPGNKIDHYIIYRRKFYRHIGIEEGGKTS